MRLTFLDRSRGNPMTVSRFDEIRQMNNADRERLLSTIEQEAGDNEIKYWGCAQAVLDALQRHLGLGSKETFMAATALVGGIASNREACGALTGSVMAIGLAYGRARYEAGKIGPEQAELIECNARARKFCDRFREKLGGLRCSEIRAKLGFALQAEAPKLTSQTFKEHEKCGHVTATAARLAAEIVLEPAEVYATQTKSAVETMTQYHNQLAREASESADLR